MVRIVDSAGRAIASVGKGARQMIVLRFYF
jgi:hypothetical protein